MSMTAFRLLRCSPTRYFSTSLARRSKLENVLDGGPPLPVQVTRVSTAGIELADGLVVTSSCIFLGGKVFLWKVPPTLWNAWDNDRFEIFEVTIPKPEILLLGTGLSTIPPPTWMRQHLRRLGIGIEVMDTRNACSTYNLLAEEGRRVAAALLPLKKFSLDH